MLEIEARATEQARVQSDEARRELERNLEEVAQASQRLDAERAAGDVERAKLSSRIEFLLDRERDLEELSKAARVVVEGAGTDAGPCLPEELLGLVADHLRTDTLHARALDAALAARGRALVARDLEAARRVSAWLKARESGQVGLLLGAGLGAPPARARATGPAVPRLLDHIRCTAGCERLAEILVGDVHVASDLEAALALAQEHPTRRFVTLEGDLADAAGLLAGSRALTQGAVGRRSSAAELEVELERLSESLRALEAARATVSERKSTLEKERGFLGVRHEEAVAARADAETRLATARARLADLDLDRSTLDSEATGAREEVHDESRKKLAELERDVAEREAACESAAVAASEARVQAVRERERLIGIERRSADLDSVLAENRTELVRAQRLAGEYAEAARAARAEIEEAAAASARLLEERSRIDERLRELRGRDDEQREAVQTARAGVEGLQRELDTAANALSERRLEQQRLTLMRQEVLRRAAEELSQDETALVLGFEPEPELAGEDAAHRLEELETLADVGGRLEFLQKQRDDLTRARDALTSTLRTIDEESKRLFLETFDAVRLNFQRIFRQLFGGGRADVSLEEGADVLDAGVEIVARPPGRELLPIGLLSGGQRTLTALALLFAVFEARPSPFCILDEVDAALDDANVERFLAMLDGFRTSTQFVVVTHNKGTMAACQGLYGVTMETKGVSRHVAVQLDEVDTFTQRAAAPPPAALDADTGEPLVEILPQAAATEPQVDGRPRSRRGRPAIAENGTPELASEGVD